ncbi:MAG: DUF4276 family protein [Planctomycetes bacterium]|nr:DUF4276 family protein [Planctomycetota bacterium]
MSELVFFLEEPSSQAMLQGFLPNLFSNGVPFRYIVFEGKQDLEMQLVRRMRGYRDQDARFVVLRDQDAASCKKVKSLLAGKCAEAGRPEALVRIACHELESWYLGDLSAVEKGLGLRGLSKKHQNKRRCAIPDQFPNPSQTLRKIAPSYQKVGGSRAIGPHLDPDNNRSHSFAVFVTGLRKFASLTPARRFHSSFRLKSHLHEMSN